MRWYLRTGLSYRAVDELLAERCVEVADVTIFRWVQRLTLGLQGHVEQRFGDTGGVGPRAGA